MADLRAQRTRGYLREALTQILQEKPFDQVTVREVVQRARVSKNSFYNHYPDLASLAQDCFLQTLVYFGPEHKRLRDYGNREEACGELLDETAQMLTYFKENPGLGRVILDNICISPYFTEARGTEEDLIVDHLDTEYGPDCCAWASNQDCARYIVWGMFGSYLKWFRAGMAEPVEDVTRRIVYFALASTAGMAGRPIEPEYLATIEGWQPEG